jgi:hypothetical protein
MQNTIITSTPPAPYATVRIARLADQRAEELNAVTIDRPSIASRAAALFCVVFVAGMVVANAILWTV